jgi:type IV secretory pathway TrbD component
LAQVYQSLTRPKLHSGGEWYAVGGLGIFCITLVLIAIVTHRWWPALTAAAIYWPGLWLARRAAKKHPQYLVVYFQALTDAQRPILEPHGFADTHESAAPEIYHKPPRWIR